MSVKEFDNDWIGLLISELGYGCLPWVVDQ